MFKKVNSGKNERNDLYLTRDCLKFKEDETKKLVFLRKELLFFFIQENLGLWYSINQKKQFNRFNVLLIIMISQCRQRKTLYDIRITRFI